jgi:hypothetical protein
LRFKKLWMFGVAGCGVLVALYLYDSWQFESSALWSTKIYATYPTEEQADSLPSKAWIAKKEAVWEIIDLSMSTFYGRGFFSKEVKKIPYPQEKNQFGFYAQHYSISDGGVEMVAIWEKGSSVELLDVQSFGDLRGANPISSHLDLKSFIENELDKKFTRAKPEK